MDFPHEGVEYLHLNLHEPNRETAIPLTYKQYSILSNKYGDLNNLFFEYGNLYWFRYNFLLKLDSIVFQGTEENNQFREDIQNIFYKQSHYKILRDEISKENMLEFVNELGIALIHAQVCDATYIYTEVDNIDEELTKIRLRDIWSEALGQYEMIYLKEQLHNKNKQEKFSELKRSLLGALFKHFEQEMSLVGTYEEFEGMDLEDILLLLDDIIC